MGGSVVAADWLGHALLVGLLLAAVLLSGGAARPGRLALGGVAGLLALAAWTAVSLRWSPSPSLARDEALLVLLYAVAFLVPATTLRSETERLAAILTVAGAVSAVTVATAVKLALTDDASQLYEVGRLFAPIGYWNAQAALCLVPFWPLLTLAALRTVPLVLRSLSFAGAVAALAGLLLTQSRGGVVALGVSALVVFAVSPARLRLAVPALFAAGFTAVLAAPLTAPFRAGEEGLTESVRTAGLRTLVALAVALLVGLLYALGDRRAELSARALRLVRVLAALALAVGVLAGVAVAASAVDHPGRLVQEKWQTFKTPPVKTGKSTNLAYLGSTRYDLWRVALGEFREHPLAGAGARGFGAAYLEHGRTGETPQRAHSLLFDTLGETGLVGLVLLAGSLGLLLAALWREARRSLVAAGLLAAGVSWLVHSSLDWIWTFPAVGLPALCLLGIGVSSRRREHRPSAHGAASGRLATLRRHAPLALGVVVAAVTVLAFAPPWLSARFTTRALEGSPSASRDLRWARRLDPLSTEPLLAESSLADSPPGTIAPLERAVRQEPRSFALRYLLALEQLRANRRRAARINLLAARRLYPREQETAQALRRTLPVPKR
ncbi:MAG: O-antigen ligase family protein [Actinobacteria bacterium]|nr:O-antigen ligase family protein [Actinomycetota bacterium]